MFAAYDNAIEYLFVTLNASSDIRMQIPRTYILFIVIVS